HWKRNEIDVHASWAASKSPATPNYGDTFSIKENQSFFRQQTPQVRYDGAIAAEIHTALGASRTHLLRQAKQQVRGVTDGQLLNVSRTIGVHRIWTGLLCGGNVRTSDDDTFHFCRSGSRRWRRILARHNRHGQNRKRDARCQTNTKGAGSR